MNELEKYNNQDIFNPEYLYHGSPYVMEKIEPREAKDSVNKENENLCVTYKKGEENLTGLIEFLKLNNIKYSRIFSELPSLNDVFLELTGKGLRD